jgi:hypothetical protein
MIGQEEFVGVDGTGGWVSSAVLFYSGTRFAPIAALTLCPLPVLLVAPRVPGRVAVGVASWRIGEQMGLLPALPRHAVTYGPSSRSHTVAALLSDQDFRSLCLRSMRRIIDGTQHE